MSDIELLRQQMDAMEHNLRSAIEATLPAVANEMANLYTKQEQAANLIQERDTAIAELQRKLQEKAKPGFDLRDASRALHLQSLGVPMIALAYESEFYPAGQSSKDSGSPTPAAINLMWQRWRQRFPKAKEIVIDIEGYWSGGVTVDKARIPVDAVKAIRAKDENILVTTYSTLERSLSILTGGPALEPARTQEWYAKQRLLYQPLINEVHFMAHSAYAITANEDLFRRYLLANIKINRVLAPGKKVIVFIQPIFHRNALGVDGKTLDGQLVPGRLWRLTLETCREFADGAAVWLPAGFNPKPEDQWYRETEEFVLSL